LTAAPRNLRVHISPVGYDPIERVTDALIQYRADRVYLMTYRRDDPAAKEFGKVKQALDRQRIEAREVYLDIWDLFSCIEKYREIFSRENGNHIYVNVSTGSKIVSIAGMLSCMLWNGSPYYTRLDYTDRNPAARNGSVERKVVGTDFLPVYEIIRPPDDSMKVLAIIDRAGGRISKKALIDILQSREYQMIPQDNPSQTKSAPHSRLRAILDPLEQHWGFVSIQARGRKSEIILTDKARSALRIFGCGN
jgi:hypothetical protein